MREIDRLIYMIDTEVFLIFQYAEYGWADMCEQVLSHIERLVDTGASAGSDPEWQDCLSRTCDRLCMLGYAIEGLWMARD